MDIKNKKIIIIGAGLGGLSAAALLAKEGANVTVLEKNEQVGGRASYFEQAGYVFDMGPSWYLMPEVFERFFANFGKKPQDYYNLKRLTPSYKIFTKESTIEVPSNLPDLYKLFDTLEPNGGEKLKKYLQDSKTKYDISLEHFVYKSYRSPLDFFNKTLFKNSLKLNVLQDMQSYVESQFESDIARKILQCSIVFLGASPNNAPAMYSLISHADLNKGVFYPLGGIKELPTALKSLCEDLNVSIKLNEPVLEIAVENKKATKVITSKNQYPADLVVANADYHFVETNLLPKNAQSISPSSWDKKVLAPSAFIMYLGINKRLSNLEHHNFIWKSDWDSEYEAIFNTQTLPEDPSIYICMPSKTDPSVAPKGCESLFILIPTAVDLEDNPEVREKLTQKVLSDFIAYLGQDISENLQVKKSFFIKDFKSRYNAYKGTGLGLSHTLSQSAIFRPKNFSKKVKNLYYTGQFTNPGTGMPMVIISSEIVLNEIKNKKNN